jgi:putative ABC transport system permease protein
MILAYTIRGLWTRRATTAMNLLAVSLAMAAVTVMLALVHGLSSVLTRGGVAENAVVVTEGSLDDAGAALSPERIAAVEVVPGIAEGRVSPEFVTSVELRLTSGPLDLISIRGVESAAFDVHKNVRLVAGRMPAHGEPGVAVGLRQVGRFEGLTIGGTVPVGRHRWPVLGILAAPGLAAESQLWCDRAALLDELHRSGATVVAVTLKDRASQGAFAAAIRRATNNALEAVDEPAWLARAAAQMAVYLRAVIAAVALLILGAALAAGNAVYSSFLARTRELATLRAIGFSRSRLTAMLVAEGLLIAMVSGVIGLLAGVAAQGHQANFGERSLVFTAEMSGQIIVGTLALAFGVGLIASTVSTLGLLWLPIIRALRE